MKERLIEQDPTLDMETMKPDKKPPMVLAVSEVERLLAAPDVSTAQGMRDKAMLELLYATGIKVSELISLNVDDVHTDMKFARCTGTSGKERVVPIGTIAAESVAAYTSLMRDKLLRDHQEEPAMFLNSLGGRLTRQGFWKIIKNTHGKQTLSRILHRIRLGIPSPPIYWKVEQICVPYNKCWVMLIFRRLRFITVSPVRI